MTVIHLMCLTSSGGLPIFNRNFGDTESLPFSTVGSLNGIHMFCKSQSATLHSTQLDDGSLVMWREFHNAITLIALTARRSNRGGATDLQQHYANIGPSASTSAGGHLLSSSVSAAQSTGCHPLTERALTDLLDLVFGSMVLAVGLHQLCSIGLTVGNVDQLKRELKPIYGHIDALLAAAAADDLLRYSECVLSSEGSQLLERLNEFSARVATSFCCLLVHDKVVVGTEGWWALHGTDRKLLLVTVRQLTGSNSVLASNTAPPPPVSIDVPVYLPHKSPNVAFRWVVVPVWQNVRVAVICGAQPRRDEIERLVRVCWSAKEQPLVEAAEMSWHRNVPPAMQFGQGILGFVLVNRRHGKYVCAQNVHQTINTRKRASTSGHRLDILRSFWQQTVDVEEVGLTEWPPVGVGANKARSVEAYWCSDYHKCHAYASEEYLLCVLYFAAIPTHIMRLTTQKTLNTIISEKGTTW